MCDSVILTSFPLNILRTNSWNLTKFSICIDVDQICVGIFIGQFLQIYNRVMALGYYLSFISTQYLLNELMEFDDLGAIASFESDITMKDQRHFTSAEGKRG